MTEAALTKLRPMPMAELLARLALSGEGAAMIQSDPDPAAALGRLEAAGLMTEAAKLVAHVLPQREAVWWACMCARHTATPELTEHDRAAVTAAESWVRKLSDEMRREAFDHAQQAGFGTPEAWAAVAAFWSGDSMSPLGQPKTPPAPHLTGAAVIGSVTLAAVRTYPDRREQRLRRFLASGREIAAGGAGRLEREEIT